MSTPITRSQTPAAISAATPKRKEPAPDLISRLNEKPAKSLKGRVSDKPNELSKKIDHYIEGLTPQKRRWLAIEGQTLLLSRAKIDFFLQCERCFYLDKRIGISRPKGLPFTLHVAVDYLLKKEFDVYREKKEAHPIMLQAGVKAIPYSAPEMADWRENFKGIIYHDKERDIKISGAVDDIWVNESGELIVVDYKATSKEGEITFDQAWHEGYKRQVEVYQWLLRKNGYKVSDTAYFVYCNGKKDVPSFANGLKFDIQLIKYKGDDEWVSGTIADIDKCLHKNEIPKASDDCEHCRFSIESGKFTRA